MPLIPIAQRLTITAYSAWRTMTPEEREKLMRIVQRSVEAGRTQVRRRLPAKSADGETSGGGGVTEAVTS
jgi:hypothetical protein